MVFPVENETAEPMNHPRLLLCWLFWLFAATITVHAQDNSNKGKEFWIAYPSHIDGTNSVMGLYLTSNVATSGTIQVGASNTINFSITPNQLSRFFLGNSGTVDGPNGTVYLNMADGVKTNAAIKITSKDPIVVYSHIIRSARSGATLVLPTPVLGAEYIVPSYGSVSTSAPGAGSNGTNGGVGLIAVVATQDNTTIEITPTANGANGTGRLAGVPYTVNLATAGDVYQLQSASLGDLSGSKVRSVSASGSGCKPIAVYSASTWSTFDCTGASGGDNLFQQLFPTRSWGKQFVTAPFINRPNDIYRIYVQKSSTAVQVQDNGVTTTLGAAAFSSTGNFYTYRTSNPIMITGSDPISVVQYISSQSCKTGCTTGSVVPTCYADPEMVILSPVEQTLSDITFFSAHQNFVPPGQTQVTQHYVNIIISRNFKSTLKIDNANPKSAFVDIPGTNYSYLQEDLTSSSAANPVHRVTADSSFSAIVYGYGNVESYGYNGGTNVKDFSRTATFSNAFARIDSAVTCVNTPLKISVPFGFQPTNIRWDFSAAPNITPAAGVGPTANPVADSIPVVSGVPVYYFSTGQTYSFTAANTTAVRDTIKIYTTSATPDGCGSTDQVFTIPVKVSERPSVSFVFTNTGCVGDVVTLTPSASTAARILWDFGDGTTTEVPNLLPMGKSYTSSGNYNVKLKVISDIGCLSDEVSQTIPITNKPQAAYTVSAIRCQDKDIIFTDASTSSAGTITKWSWDLATGAGIAAVTTNAAQTARYNSTGAKTVTLQVETASGCKSDVYSTNVVVNALPVVGFTLPQVCLNDASAQFTDTSRIADGTESQFTYLWNFNAGSPVVTPGPNITSSTLKNPSVKYNKSDYYTVSLRVTSKDGCVSSLNQSFTVNGTTPKADFTVQNASQLCSKTPVTIINQSTVDFGNVTRLQIYWDYGNNPTQVETDNAPVANKQYTHIYPVTVAAGQSFTIRMVAYSGGNTCVHEKTQVITVYPNPVAGFTVSPTAACFGATLGFTDISATRSNVAPARWVWDLAGGNSSTIANPAKQFRDSGLFNTSLHVYSAQGCVSDTMVQAVRIYPLPIVQMGNTKLVVLEGGSVTLKPAFVYGNALQYLWTPSSYLSSDQVLSPVSTPVNDITYRLTVTAEGNCQASDTVHITVLKSPEIPNAFSPNGDGINDLWNIKYLESYPGATVDVYNRYGQVVFRSIGYSKPWDGSTDGKVLPVGTYYYIINPKNGKPVMTGSITIIR